MAMLLEYFLVGLMRIDPYWDWPGTGQLLAKPFQFHRPWVPRFVIISTEFVFKPSRPTPRRWRGGGMGTRTDFSLSKIGLSSDPFPREPFTSGGLSFRTFPQPGRRYRPRRLLLHPEPGGLSLLAAKWRVNHP